MSSLTSLTTVQLLGGLCVDHLRCWECMSVVGHDRNHRCGEGVANERRLTHCMQLYSMMGGGGACVSDIWWIGSQTGAVGCACKRRIRVAVCAGIRLCGGLVG